MGFVIGSFNIQDFSGDGLYIKRGTPDGANSAKRDIAAIADIIVKEGFDIVALQEVRDAHAVERLKKYLPGYWKSYCNIKPSVEPEFAFLWNGFTFGLYRNSDDEIVLPEVVNLHSGWIKRDPYYGRFTPKLAPKAEIRLINVHLKSGQGPQTREEFGLVSGEIYERLNADRDGNNMDVYTIILGDYNLSSVFCNSCEAADPQTYLTATRQSSPTTINKPKNSLPTGYTANDYDHFGFNLEESEITLGHVDAVAKYSGGDFAKYRQHISDHIPIRLELNLNQRRK